MRRAAPFLIALAVLVGAGMALGQEKPSEKPPEKPAQKPAEKPAEKAAEKPAPEAAQKEPPHPEQSVTQHSVIVAGTPIAYTATAGTLIVRNEKDEPWASIGYIAYVRKVAGAPA
ncbi:MAG TPA: hypothetical protein VGL03_10745, partial [Thermoanaerobaculia bacterium]